MSIECDWISSLFVLLFCSAPIAVCPTTRLTCYGDAVFSNTPLARPQDSHIVHWNTESVWSDPYLDEGGTNLQIMTHSVPVYRSGIRSGLVSLDVLAPAGASSHAPPMSTFFVCLCIVIPVCVRDELELSYNLAAFNYVCAVAVFLVHLL